jgi:hypothetical protein
LLEDGHFVRDVPCAGLKPNLFPLFTARLKSCPDTKPAILGETSYASSFLESLDLQAEAEEIFAVQAITTLVGP